MKISIAIILFSLPFGLLAQSEVAGIYRNYSFCEIQLNADSTFLFSWYRDLYGAWAKGKWTLKKDTVYFHKIPMYDTLHVTEKNGSTVDTLLLSKYSKQRRLTAEMLSEITVQQIEQNGNSLPDTMLFKENRLYEMKDGSIITEKQPGIRRGSEHDPWYFKLAKE